jgi:hypothetical protein
VLLCGGVGGGGGGGGGGTAHFGTHEGPPVHAAESIPESTYLQIHY